MASKALSHRRTLRLSSVALTCAVVCSGAAAQETVTITGRVAGSAGIAGFGDVPPARAPVQAISFAPGTLADLGVTQLGAVARLDAALGDAYNAEGYWAGLMVRGYVLDPRFNLRRDGLPINGETSINLANKARLDLLKGISGIQSGTSAPAGLVDLIVKRPHSERREIRLEAREPGSTLAAIDIDQPLDGGVAVRLNAAYERLDPPVRNTRGERSMLSLAADWRVGPATLLQAEIEANRQRQPSVVGYSLLGDMVPSAAAIDTRRNLNDQRWRQSVVFDGDTASLRWQQQLGADWRFTLHGAMQRLRNDDRTAFPFGVYDPNTFACAPCDRFAADGTFTYWEFISDNERRNTTAWQAMLAGRIDTGPLAHRLEGGVLRSRHWARFQDQVFDIAGTGRIDGSLVTPPSGRFADANTDRDERSTEWFARDAITVTGGSQLWAGLRHTQLERATRRTSVDSLGSLRAIDFERSATTPWLALSTPLTARTMLYASWGRGLETDAAPNLPRYANPGESFALASRQIEVGMKHGSDEVEAALTLFDIDREQTADLGPCDIDASCRRQLDGGARHRGVELAWNAQAGSWSWNTSAMWLDAERRGSAQASINGLRPVNVPTATLRAGVQWRAAAVPGLALLAQYTAESDRVALPYDERVRIPGWSRLDLGVRYAHDAWGSRFTWRLGVDNATDRRAWKESPYQFGHSYLYALPPRTWRLMLQVAS